MFKKMTSRLLATTATAMLIVLVAGSVSGYMHMSCVNRNLRLSLDDAIHISDVVFTGKITTMRNGIGTTKTATVTYYYAYKSDQHMPRRGLGRAEVQNVMANASMGESTVFFLVREPSLILALQCMAPVAALRNTEFRDVVRALNRIQTVGKSDNARNAKFVLPSPDPCASSPCSLVGSQCSTLNTLPGDLTRCTCLTGYFGDGAHCTAIGGVTDEPTPSEATSVTPQPTTPPTYECSQCSYGALCLDNPSLNSTLCDCSHIQCTGVGVALCGTNGVTYESHCELQLEACQLQRPVFGLHNGSCDLQDVAPCGGLANPLTNEQGLVECVESEKCPTMHFCHSAELYSVCCPVTLPPSQSPPLPSVQPTATAQPSPSPAVTCTPVPAGSGALSGSGFPECEDGSTSGDGTMVDDEDFNPSNGVNELTCHCSGPLSDCSEDGTCTIRSTTLQELACFAVRIRAPNGSHTNLQSCILSNTDLCGGSGEAASQEGNGHVCCRTDKCNTVERLNEVAASLSETESNLVLSPGPILDPSS